MPADEEEKETPEAGEGKTKAKDKKKKRKGNDKMEKEVAEIVSAVSNHPTDGKVDGALKAVTQAAAESDPAINHELVVDFAKKIQLQLQASTSASAARDLAEAKQHNYEFWATQPVPQLST